MCSYLKLHICGAFTWELTESAVRLKTGIVPVMTRPKPWLKQHKQDIRTSFHMFHIVLYTTVHIFLLHAWICPRTKLKLKCCISSDKNEFQGGLNKRAFRIVSHQSILVDIRPLHLFGFRPSQHHGTTQDIQVFLQQQHTINTYNQRHIYSACHAPLLKAESGKSCPTIICHKTIRPWLAFSLSPHKPVGSLAAASPDLPSHKASSPETLKAVFHHYERAIKNTLRVSMARRANRPFSQRLYCHRQHCESIPQRMWIEVRG